MRGRWSGDPSEGPLAYRLEVDTAVPGEAAAAFLDRDGTLNDAVPDPESGLPESPLRTSDVRLLPDVAAAIRSLLGAGFEPVCVTNQPAAAKGKVTLNELLAVHERVVALLAQEGAILGNSLLCPHHPQGVVPGLSRVCICRKPQPGMLLAAAAGGLCLERSWLVGDTDADIAAGHAAGCRTVLVNYPGSAHKRGGGISPELRAGTLTEGVSGLLAVSSSGAA